jgi:uncharacterized protein
MTPNREQINIFIRGAMSGNEDIIQSFIELYPAAIDERNWEGRTAIITAASRGHADAVRLLAESGAVLDGQDALGKTALMYAVWYGDAPLVGLLLEKGAVMSARDKNGETALMIAERPQARNGKEIAALLRRHGEKQEDAVLKQAIADFSPALKRSIPAPRPLRIHRSPSL